MSQIAEFQKIVQWTVSDPKYAHINVRAGFIREKIWQMARKFEMDNRRQRRRLCKVMKNVQGWCKGKDWKS